MLPSSPAPMLRPCLSALLCVLLCTACSRPTISVYTAPKDLPATPSTPRQSAEAGEPIGERIPDAVSPETPAHPQLTYDVPAGWAPGPVGQVSAASFTIKTDAGEATINITPLANFAGREEAVINMWRNQVGVAPLSSAEAAAALSPVEVAGTTGQLFEVTGSRDGKSNRIVTAMLHRPDGTWFYKLAGDESVVAAQKPAFLTFLRSLRFQSPSSAAAASSPTTPVATPSPAVPKSSSTNPSSTPAPARLAPTAPALQAPVPVN